MKEKSQIEKKAEEKQITLLSTALSEASNAGGHWLNASGKGYPRLYPKGVSVSAFNALFMTLHSDKNGCKTNQFTLFSDAKAQGASVRENEQGVPFLFYNWNKYVHRNNPEQVISRDDYMKLYEEEQKLYKGVHNREIRTLFNIDQTTLPYVDKERYETTLRRYGSAVERGYTEADNRRLHIQFNDFLLRMRDNLVPVRLDGSGVPHYETDKDAVYMPRQREFRHYHDYIQEALRQIVSATGHQQRLAREGMVMKNGVAPSEDAVRQERLVVELASGIKMLELGLPARLSEESLKTVEYWCRELKENPNLMDALESDVNNAIETIDNLVEKRKVNYDVIRGQLPTKDVLLTGKDYSISADLNKLPSMEAKEMVVVLDRKQQTADVILPSGASLLVNNEVQGMSKKRIGIALKKEDVKEVSFYNAGGSLALKEPNSYYKDKEVTVSKLKQFTLEIHQTIDVSSQLAEKQATKIEKFQAIQDSEGKYAFFIKPENEKSFSIYPMKEHLNAYFNVMGKDNKQEMHQALAQKYYDIGYRYPESKQQLIVPNTEGIDMSRIEKVRICADKDDPKVKVVIATVDGERMQKPIAKQQWYNLWLADDMAEYKKAVAAVTFIPQIQQTAGNNQQQVLENEGRNVPEKEPGEKEDSHQEASSHRGFHR